MIGRLDELNQLERFYNSSKFEFLTMYGRRRIGKTTILREFAGRHKALFFSAQEKNDSLNLLDFSKMVQTFFEGSFISSFQNWEAAFEYITGKISDEKLVLIIDELPSIIWKVRNFSQIIVKQRKQLLMEFWAVFQDIWRRFPLRFHWRKI